MSRTARVVWALAGLWGLSGARALAGQTPGAAPEELDRVLAFPAKPAGEQLDPDRGAMGAWQRIRKLVTTAGLLHITAHPDDEHSGMLALAGRGWGARTALLSLNRGEGGANAIGPELFDGLGLIRTVELVVSGRYYGLDDLYFTTAVDYGFSKSVEEAFRSWDRESVLEDMVRVIRLNRPLVVVSRFHGSERDGHGHHQAAGMLVPEAVAAAADPERFPQQIENEGLRPWRVLRTFRGGVRIGEPAQVDIDATVPSPWLGATYARWAARGLALQRSQTAGRVRSGGGRYQYEEIAGCGVDAPGCLPLRKEEAGDGGEPSFFTGMDTTLPGLPALLGETATPEAARQLEALQELARAISAEFDFRAPEHSVPALVRGLGWVRSLVAAPATAPEVRFHLGVKARQFEDAISAVRGLEVQAEWVGGEVRSAVVTPGEHMPVRVTVSVPRGDDLVVSEGRIVDRAGRVLGRTTRFSPAGEGFTAELEVRAPEAGRAAAVTDGPATAFGPYYRRDGLAENHYQITDSSALHLPWRRSDLVAEVDLVVEGTDLRRKTPLTASVPRLPYGSVTRTVAVLPALSVMVDPAVRMIPVASDAPGGAAPSSFTVSVRVAAAAGAVAATIRLELPAGWAATPEQVAHDFHRPGESTEVAFHVVPAEGWRGEATVRAVAEANGRPYRSGYRTIDHLELRIARLRRPARAVVRSVPVARLAGARVGYVMGVGDEVPAAIAALGAEVRLLDEAALADPATLADLSAIVVGTRAYAVRDDLVRHNRRLIEYARGGGNLVVLYQTQEYVPETQAPYPASLPRGAEEVSEEDAPVRLLQPEHPLLNHPNRIIPADFEGWVEQRGSKFFASWDEAYTPLVETHDRGQAPQEGVWLTTPVGRGRFTYLALALHRQLPYGVPGALRILSNVLSASAGG